MLHDNLLRMANQIPAAGAVAGAFPMAAPETAPHGGPIPTPYVQYSSVCV
jgi:hypothetical protein